MKYWVQDVRGNNIDREQKVCFIREGFFMVVSPSWRVIACFVDVNDAYQYANKKSHRAEAYKERHEKRKKDETDGSTN